MVNHFRRAHEPGRCALEAQLPLGTRGTTGFRYELCSCRCESLAGKHEIESSNPHNSISHLDGKIELPAWQFVGACPTETRFVSICGFAVDYFSAETDSGIGLP